MCRGLFSLPHLSGSFPPLACAGGFCDRTARRSRTTERSESVSEEAEYPSYPAWATLRTGASSHSFDGCPFHPDSRRATMLSQYTLR
ncbi:hypothetical protein AIA82_24680 [Salmonella enterica subsp. enterica serovar Montevideo]|nr:hypothetical protein [Salmonella enterica subsp. enterica serovar Montevideo]EDU6244124.1 hypothetical protein [Salmonella enterica subsp. enterica serovar Mbandaka]EBL4990522.1 hypothetical protein [Salmonella enterica subsp. enterica serovar Montevideo]EBN3512722.1 hypothetical protein [Salmonella enterica subsp. enterica serovar Montevideo]EDB6855594.1 hypothetical protein [Salmonella enterica subsp. enterica serovar Montevideo]